jgi:hypothetical protein
MYKFLLSSIDTTICLGGREAPVFLLEDGTRVLTQSGMARILGFTDGTAMRKALSSSRIQPFVFEAMGNCTNQPKTEGAASHHARSVGTDGNCTFSLEPIHFVRPGEGGKTAKGYPSSFFTAVLARIYARAVPL